ncbi:MAG TPA: hypothetical protein VF600_06670 [Abditibacteriaceae bacterium]|jgi:hypothetical protein
MFTNRKLRFLTVALATALGMNSIQRGCAQELPVAQRRNARNSQEGLQEAGIYDWKPISTRHIEPSLLVWWLNPLDQPEPEVVRQ